MVSFGERERERERETINYVIHDRLKQWVVYVMKQKLSWIKSS